MQGVEAAKSAIQSQKSELFNFCVILFPARRIFLFSAGRDISRHDFAQQVRKIGRRLRFANAVAVTEKLIRSTGTKEHEFVADKTARADRRDRIVLELDPVVDAQSQATAVLREGNGFNLADLDAGNFHRVPDLEPRHRGEISIHDVAPAAKDLELAQTDREITETSDSDQNKDADDQFRTRLIHR